MSFLKNPKAWMFLCLLRSLVFLFVATVQVAAQQESTPVAPPPEPPCWIDPLVPQFRGDALLERWNKACMLHLFPMVLGGGTEYLNAAGEVGPFDQGGYNNLKNGIEISVGLQNLSGDPSGAQVMIIWEDSDGHRPFLIVADAFNSPLPGYMGWSTGSNAGIVPYGHAEETFTLPQLDMKFGSMLIRILPDPSTGLRPVIVSAQLRLKKDGNVIGVISLDDFSLSAIRPASNLSLGCKRVADDGSDLGSCGLFFANPMGQIANLQVAISDGDSGAQLGTALLTIPPHGIVAKMADDVFQPSYLANETFSINSDAPIMGMSLRWSPPPIQSQ